MKAQLPSFFILNQAKDLIRIGRDNDGGYLVSKSDIEKSDLLIGLGICDDCSFESDFAKYNDIDVIAYDASVNFKFWLKRILIETVQSPLGFIYGFKKLFAYKSFFNTKHKHIKKFVGLSTSNDIDCTFLDVLAKTNSTNIFLKIDIEGSEYRFLDDILANEDRITGLAIELHDCDIHLKEIERFIKNCGLNLVHIHANNTAPIRLDYSLPLVLELTFSKFAKFSDANMLPHKLDMPNSKLFAEYELEISNQIS